MTRRSCTQGLCACAVWMGLCVQTPLSHAQGSDQTAADSAATAISSLAQQRAQARQQQAALRERLAALQQEIAAQDAQRRDATQALKASEQAISTLHRELQQLRQQSEAVQAELTRLQSGVARQTAALDQRRQTLSEQLHAQYVNGLSPWAVLLAGGDPQEIGRNLGYLGYVSQAQADAMRGVQQALGELEHVRLSVQNQQRELEGLRDAAQTRVRTLQAQQQVQQQQLQQMQERLRARRAQADQVLRDVQGLESLVSKLEAEIARAEDARAKQELPSESAGLNTVEEFKGLQGLEAHLPHPVPGQVYGRFGAQRPEGGLWRGVVIRAASGTPVRAVAPGRVVYANWLTGFGNLMIVDHGAQYLTVYAYNQSLLHAVGDVVGVGQTLALVGATGGQVEPGLYFEIRHKGAPVNPRLWLQP